MNGRENMEAQSLIPRSHTTKALSTHPPACAGAAGTRLALQLCAGNWRSLRVPFSLAAARAKKKKKNNNNKKKMIIIKMRSTCKGCAHVCIAVTSQLQARRVAHFGLALRVLPGSGRSLEESVSLAASAAHCILLPAERAADSAGPTRCDRPEGQGCSTEVGCYLHHSFEFPACPQPAWQRSLPPIQL